MIVRVARLFPHVLWITGVPLLLGALFMLYAWSLPWTDPNHQELRRISRGRWSSALTAVGATVMIASGVGIAVSRRRSLRGDRII